MKKRTLPRRSRRVAKKTKSSEPFGGGPLLNARTLSRSMRERHYYRYTVVPKAIQILGVAGLLEYALQDCDSKKLKAWDRGHKNVARLLHRAACIFNVARRRMSAEVTSEGLRMAFSGNKRLAREIRAFGKTK